MQVEARRYALQVFANLHSLNPQWTIFPAQAMDHGLSAPCPGGIFPVRAAAPGVLPFKNPGTMRVRTKVELSVQELQARMELSLRIGICLGRGVPRMTVLLQFLAVLSTVFLCYFHVFHGKEQRRSKAWRFSALFRSPERRSVTRAEWKRGLY